MPHFDHHVTNCMPLHTLSQVKCYHCLVVASYPGSVPTEPGYEAMPGGSGSVEEIFSGHMVLTSFFPAGGATISCTRVNR